jgi:elongation factor P
MAKIANDIRVGNILDYEGKLWRVLKTEHVKPGKGGAFCQVEMKEIRQGTKLNQRFRSEETIEVAHYEERDFQYLFTDGNNVTLMDPNNYEQIEVNIETFGAQKVFLQDGMKIVLEYAQDQIVGARVPAHITLKVAETEAAIKNQTASGSNKPAIMENGVRVMVPAFINVDDMLVVRTEDSTYVNRA